ncbi:MAG: hypothetical protein CVT96_02220 [Bacteroidetes bacterium HGW-Bacteroidetes-13]|nr:MAG: hypothetical protein CVT96_02220 [Bacteroidetes bacterium HGW-Bacteroidetes-13]
MKIAEIEQYYALGIEVEILFLGCEVQKKIGTDSPTPTRLCNRLRWGNAKIIYFMGFKEVK